MKQILAKAISDIVKKSRWITRDEPLHQNKEKIQRELITYKIKSENDFVYKTEINKDIIIYEYFFEKIKDKDNGPCIVTRIYFSNDEIWEKIVYINDKETDVEQKIIEQYRVYFCKKELLEESQFIKNENDNQVVIRKKSILDFKNKENINGIINNDEKIKESKNTLGKRLGRWVGKFFIFALETYLFGVVSGIISVLALKIPLVMALCWWTPAALGIATLTCFAYRLMCSFSNCSSIRRSVTKRIWN